MKRKLSFFLFLLLLSCTTMQAREAPVVATPRIIPTNTLIHPTPIPSITPSTTPTLEPPCDPFQVDFCITDGHFIFQRPIRPPGNDLVDAAYRYGSTADGTRDPHHGVEFSNPSGTPVHAAGDGMVIFAGPDEEAVYSPWYNFYGNLVIIQHDSELFTFYAHLSRIDVEVDQKVFTGDKIGEVGWTGGAVGSHLHFEVRSGDPEDYFATQNPELWLVSAKDGNGNHFGMLMITVVDGEGNLVKNANFTIGHYLDASQSPDRIYYATSYSSEMLNDEENAALSELSAGHYRIAVEMNGHILERWVEVEWGKLTQVAFVVK